MENRLAVIAVLVLVASLITAPFSYNPVFASHEKTLKWKITFFTTWQECSQRNVEALQWYLRITEIYLNRYEIKNELSDNDCINIERFNESLDDIERYDLLIIIPDMILSYDYITESIEGYYLWGHFKPYGKLNVIVSNAFTLDVTDPDATWTLSHELSHFALYWKGYPSDYVEDAVHDIQDDYNLCVEYSVNRCPEVWTTIMTTDREEIPVMKIITTEDYKPNTTTKYPSTTIPKPVPNPKQFTEKIPTSIYIENVPTSNLNEYVKFKGRLFATDGRNTSGIPYADIIISDKNLMDGTNAFSGMIASGKTDKNGNFEISWWTFEHPTAKNSKDSIWTPVAYFFGNEQFQSTSGGMGLKSFIVIEPSFEEPRISKYLDTYSNTDLSLEAKYSINDDYIMVYPSLKDEFGNEISASNIQIIVNGNYKATVSSNQWSAEIFVADVCFEGYEIHAYISDDPDDFDTLYFGYSQQDIFLEPPSTCPKTILDTFPLLLIAQDYYPGWVKIEPIVTDELDHKVPFAQVETTITYNDKIEHYVLPVDEVTRLFLGEPGTTVTITTNYGGLNMDDVIFRESVTTRTYLIAELDPEIEQLRITRVQAITTIEDLENGVLVSEDFLKTQNFKKKEAQNKINEALTILTLTKNRVNDMRKSLDHAEEFWELGRISEALDAYSVDSDSIDYVKKNLIKISSFAEEAKKLEKKLVCFLFWCW